MIRIRLWLLGPLGLFCAAFNKDGRLASLAVGVFFSVFWTIPVLLRFKEEHDNYKFDNTPRSWAVPPTPLPPAEAKGSGYCPKCGVRYQRYGLRYCGCPDAIRAEDPHYGSPLHKSKGNPLS